MTTYKYITILLVSLICFNSIAGELNNSFEGKSSYIRGLKKTGLKIFSKKAPQSLKEDLLSLDLSGQVSCETSVLTEIENIFENHNFKISSLNFKRALLFLREGKVIDDLVWKLLYASVESYNLKFKKRLSYPNREDFSVTSSLELEKFENFSHATVSGACLESSFQSLYKSLNTTSVTSLKNATYLALEKNMITLRQFHEITELVNSKYQDINFSLLDYSKKVSFFDKQFPNRRQTEFSDFVTQRQSKKTLSSRERIYTQFTKFQLVTMRNLVEKLKSRLSADSININIILDGEIIEVIELDPLEQYRFSAKMIQKEMTLLEQKQLFSGKKVRYTDLLAASFETGLISAKELKYLSEIEELWSLKLTKTQKILRFVKQYSSLFLVALPNNLFYVRVLAMVGLEAVTEDDKNQNRDFSIF